MCPCHVCLVKHVCGQINFVLMLYDIFVERVEYALEQITVYINYKLSFMTINLQAVSLV